MTREAGELGTLLRSCCLEAVPVFLCSGVQGPSRVCAACRMDDFGDMGDEPGEQDMMVSSKPAVVSAQ